MKLNSVALAIGLALGSASAMAVVTPLDLSSGSASFGNTPPAGGFMDAFTFTTTTPFSFSSSITAVMSGAQDVDFTMISLTGPGGLFSFTQIFADPFETFALSTGTLAAGSYSITLLGTNTAAIGSYGGNAAITPVPEPETYALMFAGIGVIGFIAARRRRSV